MEEKILHLLELVKLWNKSAKPRDRQNVLSTISDSLLRPTQFVLSLIILSGTIWQQIELALRVNH
jgi:hypothetical protein